MFELLEGDFDIVCRVEEFVSAFYDVVLGTRPETSQRSRFVKMSTHDGGGGLRSPVRLKEMCIDLCIGDVKEDWLCVCDRYWIFGDVKVLLDVAIGLICECAVHFSDGLAEVGDSTCVCVSLGSGGFSGQRLSR